MADIKNTYGTGLRAHWTLDEASGNRSDSHTNSYTLTDNNTVASATGKLNNGADFEASTNEYLSRTDALGLTATGDFSISMWVKLESSGTTKMTPFSYNINNGTADQQIYSDMGVGGSNVLRMVSGTGSVAQYTWSGVSTGTWYHLVFTYKYNTATVGQNIYINGSLVASSSSEATFNGVTADSFCLGASVFGGGFPPFGRYFDGVMDEVSVWSRELSSTDVSGIYNGGAGIPYEEAGGGVVVPPQIITW